MSVKRTLGAPHLNTIFNVNAMQSDLYQVFTFRQHQSTMVCLNTLTKKKIETLLISLQSSRVCQSAVVLLKKRLYQNCFRFAQQFWSTQTQMHFASTLSFTLINTLHLSKCLNKPLWTRLTESEHLVQITFHWIYTGKWILSVENQGCTYTSFFSSLFI